MLIADEAVSALDVSVQAQVLELLEDIQQRLHLTMVFITHDLRVAAQICNRIVVMQRGRIVEQGPVAKYSKPRRTSIRARCWRRRLAGASPSAAPGANKDRTSPLLAPVVRQVKGAGAVTTHLLETQFDVFLHEFKLPDNRARLFHQTSPG